MVEQDQGEKLAPSNAQKVADHRTGRSRISKPEDLRDHTSYSPNNIQRNTADEVMSFSTETLHSARESHARDTTGM